MPNNLTLYFKLIILLFQLHSRKHHSTAQCVRDQPNNRLRTPGASGHHGEDTQHQRHDYVDTQVRVENEFTGELPPRVYHFVVPDYLGSKDTSSVKISLVT